MTDWSAESRVGGHYPSSEGMTPSRYGTLWGQGDGGTGWGGRSPGRQMGQHSPGGV